MPESLDASTTAPAGHMWLRTLARGLEGLKARRALQAARVAADDDLMHRRTPPPLRLAWRAEELVATKSRLDLAHSLRTLVRDASPRYLRSSSPVNRLAVRTESQTLIALADRLADVERPVAARGVVLLRRLLVDPSGPLYDPELAHELPPFLECAREALERN
jgi:hypothetical protein